MGNDYIHGTTTDTNGLAIIYLTPGTYKVWILDREYEVTLEDYDSYTLNITLGEITIRINTPMYEKLVDEGILDMISIEIYKNYTGYGTGTRIDVFYTDEYGIVKTYLFYNETYQIVLPGFNTTHTSYGVGYGTYINVTITGDLTIVFNLSVIIAYIDGPEGPVNYIDVECRGLGTYYYMTEYTYNGYAYFVVTPGIYSMDLESIILGISEQLVNVTEYSIVWYNKTISMINIIQNNPLAGTGDISSIRVTIESLNTSESRYIYVYQSYKVYIGNGTYKLETSEYNGHVYEYIVNVGFNKTEEVVIETRNIYVYVYKPDGTLADDQYYGISLYTQEGVGENATIGYYVKGDYGKGEFEFISITPGLYVIKLRKGHDKYVYNVNVTIEEDFITKTIVLGGLIIKLYSQGEPLSNHYISLYTSSETGDINYYVTGKYTDEEGKVEFYVTSGWYALYISDVGYLYGLYVSEGEYTVYEYSIESSDLAVENISWTPEIILENMTVLFRVNITNYGPGTVYRDFNVSFYLNNTLVYIAAVYGLEANSSKIIEAPIYVAENGVCELKIVVDEINAIYDENRTNNVKTIYFTVAKKTDIISLDKPLPNSFVEETVNVEGSINPGKTVNISIYVNHTLYTILSNTRENFTVTIDLSTYPDSPIEISVLAVTIDSTEADYEEVVVYLDKTPPYLLVVEPSNNSYVPGVFNVTVIADDPYYGLPTLPIIYVNGTNYTMIKLHDKQYIYTVNATLYIDGSILNITVYVEDYSGKKTFTTIYVVIDKTPPNTSHNSTKTWYNRDVVIVLSAIDEVSGVNSTYYRIDNGEWIKGTIVYIPAPLDHSNDGLHVIEFYSIDNAGNIEEINTLLVGIDTSEPVVTSTLINNTYFVEGTLNVSITLIDQLSGLKYYAVYLDDELVINETLNGLQNYTIHLPELILDNMDEGRYEYKVIVLDIAGNIVDKTYVFYIDRTPPTVEIISPENETLASGIVEIIFNYTDNLSSVNAFLIIDGYVVNVTGKYSYSIDTREYPDGILTITLIVVDLAGNSVNVSIVLIIDNTPPYTIILHPGNNTYVSGYLTIIFNVSDDHLDQAWLYINDTAYNVINTTNIVLDTTTLPDGLYIITLYANDTLGHESYYSVVIIVDNTIPYAEIVSPKNNTCVPEIFTVKLLYSDDNLESAYLIISNTINIDVMETYSLILNTSELGLVDGEYTLKLYVRDKAGNEASYTIKIYLDTTPPIVEISSPRDHSLVNGNITVSFNYDDPHLDNATLIINGEQIEVTGTYRYILDTTSYPDGELVITLNACDLAGNCGEYTVTIIIDNTPPIINILSPRDQQVFYTNETINITWEVIEPHLSTILLYIDENEINVTNQTSYTINASQLGIGVHTIKIMAIDKLNQTNETIITINITIPAPPTTSPISPTPKPSTSPTPATTTPTKTTPAGALPGTTIAVIIIVVVIIAALVFILRKK
ncbi:MAG: hypothetical protein B6U89_05420 [Desulfurococcales archaeon ex4484_58]|nr:MAG: hypothetical protein B6U89_05420 [Desulfurococcales archaeon ex4484_58]